jgi:hypothetical protein
MYEMDLLLAFTTSSALRKPVAGAGPEAPSQTRPCSPFAGDASLSVICSTTPRASKTAFNLWRKPAASVDRAAFSAILVVCIVVPMASEDVTIA